MVLKSSARWLTSLVSERRAAERDSSLLRAFGSSGRAGLSSTTPLATALWSSVPVEAWKRGRVLNLDHAQLGLSGAAW